MFVQKIALLGVIIMTYIIVLMTSMICEAA